MRILHIGMSSFPGGVENFVRNYYLALQNDDIVFDFVDIYGDGIAFRDEFEKMGSRFYTISNYKKHPFSGKKKLTEIIKNYTCVHIHLLSAASIIAVEAAQTAGVEPIVHAHNSDTVGVVRRTLHRLHVKKLRKLPVFHAACGFEAGRWLWGDTGFTVIPNAIDTKRFQFQEQERSKIRQDMRCSDNTAVVGFVGRLSEQKNPLFAVRAFACFHRNHPDSQMWIVGEGILFDAVCTLISEEELNDSVKLFGYRDDIPELMSGMDVLLFPSAFEGLSIAFVEAQASGLPIAASDTITSEAVFLESVRLLSLSEPMEKWCEAMSVVGNSAVRSVCAARIAEAGYDIHTAAQELLRIYSSKSSH